MREFTLFPVTSLHGSWDAVAGEYPKSFEYGIFCEFGGAEEVIGFMFFEDNFFVVGIGECLRPYRCLYEGSSEEAASAAFYTALKESIE